MFWGDFFKFFFDRKRMFPYNDSTMGDIPSSLRNINSKSVRDGYKLRPVVRPKEYSSE